MRCERQTTRPGALVEQIMMHGTVFRLRTALAVQRGKAMRWIRIREAKIDTELRETFERYGTAGMQMILAGNMKMWHKKALQGFEHNSMNALLAWLTEQHDRAERKETWSLMMEAAITAFV